MFPQRLSSQKKSILNSKYSKLIYAESEAFDWNLELELSKGTYEKSP